MYAPAANTPSAPESRIPEPARSRLRELGVIQDEAQARPITRADLTRLLASAAADDPPAVNLSGADLRGIDLRGMDLRNAVLRECNLEGATAIPLLTDANGRVLPLMDMSYENALNGWHTSLIAKHGGNFPDPADEIDPHEWLTGEAPEWLKSIQRTRLDGAVLDLSNITRADFRWASIRGAVISRCQLLNSDLSYTDLSEACLDWAKMGDTVLRMASLHGATLKSARIVDTDFSLADLRNADLTGTFISAVTDFSEAKWDKKYICRAEREGNYKDAETLYRNLKRWHNRNGHSKIAGEFHYREMEAIRKGEWAQIKQEYRENNTELKKAWQEFWGLLWKRHKGKKD